MFLLRNSGQVLTSDASMTISDDSVKALLGDLAKEDKCFNQSKYSDWLI